MLLLPLLLVAVPASAGERSFMVGNFERIRVDGPFEVRVTSGGSPRASASGDPRALDQLDVHVDGTTLVVGTGVRQLQRDAPALPVVVISVPQLRAALVNGGGHVQVAGMRGQRVDLGVNGAGRLEVSAVEADQLVLTLTGTGAATLAGRAAKARFNSNGAGTIEASGLAAGDLVVYASTAGSTRATALHTAEVTAMGVGEVVVEGAAACTAHGPGPVRCAGGTASN